MTERELILKEDDVREVLDAGDRPPGERCCPSGTDEIIAHVRKNLVGKHRRLGESVDSLVVGALRAALLDVLGEGSISRPISGATRARSGSCSPA